MLTKHAAGTAAATASIAEPCPSSSAVFCIFHLLGMTGFPTMLLLLLLLLLFLQNPDPQAAQYFASFISKAYAALTDEVSRQNYEKYGHPDGPQVGSNGR